MIKEVIPTAARVAALRHPGNPAHSKLLTDLRAVAPRFNIDVRVFDGSTVEEWRANFADMAGWPADALLVLDEAIYISMRQQLAAEALRRGLPLVCGFREMTEAGCLFSYAVDNRENYRRVSMYVDKILKGERPNELPVEQPTRIEFVINLRTASALGLHIPPAVLARADKLIE